MNILKRWANWLRLEWRKVLTSDTHPLHPLSREYSHARQSDFLPLTLPGIARGTSQDDFLAGYPRRKHPDDPTSAFPSRVALVVGHGWRVPGPKPLPVYD